MAAPVLRGPRCRRPAPVAAVTYAADESEVSTVRDEHDAARSLGLDVSWQDALDVPFPAHGATVLERTGAVRPDGRPDRPRRGAAPRTAAPCTRAGGCARSPCSVSSRPASTTDQRVRAEHVVLATGSPILDRGLYFAKVEPMRSYALAFDGAAAPQGMYLSAGSDTRSVRDLPGDGRRAALLVGGAGHSVGRTGSEAAHVDRLREWTVEVLPRSRRDPPVVGAGLPLPRRHPVRRTAAARRRSHLPRHRLRQVGDDQRRGRRSRDLGPDPRRAALLGADHGPPDHGPDGGGTPRRDQRQGRASARSAVRWSG